MSELFEFDLKISEECGGIVAGMDEAGRGPLAGPVTCAIAVMPMDFEIEGINDSKLLTPKKRDYLYDKITQSALFYAVSVIDHNRIDEINILNATKQGMRECIDRLKIPPKKIIIDAVDIACCYEVLPVIKGDQKSYSVAAASILAKVTRDRLMEEFDGEFPDYLFAKHKGYGTLEHIERLKAYGACRIHRKSFIKNFV